MIEQVIELRKKRTAGSTKMMGKPKILCRKCGRMLMRGEILCVEIKCPKCGYLQEISEKKVLDILQALQYRDTD